MPSLPSRYKPIDETFEGGTATVVICEDKILERQVAIKFVTETTYQRRMLDELAALLKMRSKHVVQVYDILKLEDGSLGIVQEFIDGQDLFDSYKTPSSPTEFYKQIWQIASGISDIHSIDVIHRDIKPNNMKTDQEGIIKIFDFGLSRNEGQDAATLGFVGTFGYAAPELYVDNVKFTKAIDTYAFGVIALFLATGDLPDELNETPPVPSQSGYFSNIPISLTQEIIGYLDACLAPVPTDRPQIYNVRDVLAKHILFDKHQALVLFRNQVSYLNSTKRTVNLNLTSIGGIEISYNGFEFVITAITGEVLVNNRAMAAGDVLPGSSVVSLGHAHRVPGSRAFITFDLSNPEIVL